MQEIEDCYIDPSVIDREWEVVTDGAFERQLAVFDEAEQLWVWMYQNEHKMFMELDEPIRFRVSAVRFPEQPRSADELVPGSLGCTPEGTFSPMVVVGDINADGLGLLSWWKQ